MTGITACENKDISNLAKGFLNDSLRDIMSIVKAQCGSLFLFDSKAKELILDAYYSSRNISLHGVKLKVGEGITGKIVDIKTPVLVKDINMDSRFSGNGLNHYMTNSFISIPLFDSRELLGVIHLADKSTGEPFSDKDLEFAVTLCRYACLIVDNLLHSERLKQEQEAFEKQKQALEKYASMGKLAAGIVHEVNNPLDGVIRYTNILLNQMENNSIAKEYLLEIKRGLHRIANITKSLLEFSHQVNSRWLKAGKYVDVHKIIEESLEVFSEKIKGSVQIERKFSRTLPRIKDIGLSHVFMNIIKNALDAMPEGGKLEIVTLANDSLVEITFKDTGFGIPDDVKGHIFEPFFTTKPLGEGTGLGLAISKEIVNKYEGDIAVQSAQGKGSTFTILIPQKHWESNG